MDYFYLYWLMPWKLEPLKQANLKLKEHLNVAYLTKKLRTEELSKQNDPNIQYTSNGSSNPNMMCWTASYCRAAQTKMHIQ